MDAGRTNAHQELIDRLDSDDYEAIISNEKRNCESRKRKFLTAIFFKFIKFKVYSGMTMLLLLAF